MREFHHNGAITNSSDLGERGWIEYVCVSCCCCCGGGGCGSAWIAVSTGDIYISLSLYLYATISTMSLSNMIMLYILCCSIVRSIFMMMMMMIIVIYTSTTRC